MNKVCTSEMLPGGPQGHPHNSLSTHPEVSRYKRVRLSKISPTADLKHGFVSQFGLRNTFSTSLSSCTQLVVGVVGVRSNSKVSNVAARRIVADKMSDNPSFRNGTVGKFPSDDVYKSASSYAALGEPVAGLVRQPDPGMACLWTTASIESHPEPVQWRDPSGSSVAVTSSRRAVTPPPLVVGAAPASPVRRIPAVLDDADIRAWRSDRRIPGISCPPLAHIVREAQPLPVNRFLADRHGADMIRHVHDVTLETNVTP